MRKSYLLIAPCLFLAACGPQENYVAANCSMVLGVPPGCTSATVDEQQIEEATAYLKRHGESVEGLIPIHAEHCGASVTIVLSDCATTRLPRMAMIELDQDGHATAMSRGK